MRACLVWLHGPQGDITKMKTTRAGLLPAPLFFILLLRWYRMVLSPCLSGRPPRTAMNVLQHSPVLFPFLLLHSLGLQPNIALHNGLAIIVPCSNG